MIKNGEIVRIEPGAKFTSQLTGHQYEVTAVEVLFGALEPLITTTIIMRLDGVKEKRFISTIIADALRKGELEPA